MTNGHSAPVQICSEDGLDKIALKTWRLDSLRTSGIDELVPPFQSSMNNRYLSGVRVKVHDQAVYPAKQPGKNTAIFWQIWLSSVFYHFHVWSFCIFMSNIFHILINLLSHQDCWVLFFPFDLCWFSLELSSISYGELDGYAKWLRSGTVDQIFVSYFVILVLLDW